MSLIGKANRDHLESDMPKATRISLPYGNHSLSIDVPSENLLGVILPKTNAEEQPDETEMIRAALENPIGSPPLRQLAHKGQRVAIVISDLTRPCPSDRLLPFVLHELAAAGIPDEDIFIVLALGLHRLMTEAEIDRLVSREVHRRIQVLNHNLEDVVSLGVTSPARRWRSFARWWRRICASAWATWNSTGSPAIRVGQKRSCRAAPHARRSSPTMA